MEKKEIKMIDDLQTALAGLKTKGEIKKFLHDLLTQQELSELARRLRAAQMLSTKIPYTEIIEETRLSSTTVARVAKWLRSDVGGFRAVLKRNRSKGVKGKNVKV